MSKETGGPAFPSIDGLIAGSDANEGNYEAYGDNGMTLRDYFAAHAPFTFNDAMDFLLKIGDTDLKGPNVMKALTSLRYIYADSMLEARSE